MHVSGQNLSESLRISAHTAGSTNLRPKMILIRENSTYSTTLQGLTNSIAAGFRGQPGRDEVPQNPLPYTLHGIASRFKGLPL